MALSARFNFFEIWGLLYQTVQNGGRYMKRDESNDIDKSSDIAKARALVNQAADIVRRGKISERAAKFLRLADQNLEHPDPILFKDDRLIFTATIDTKGKGDGTLWSCIDMGNVYVDLNEA